MATNLTLDCLPHRRKMLIQIRGDAPSGREFRVFLLQLEAQGRIRETPLDLSREVILTESIHEICSKH